MLPEALNHILDYWENKMNPAILAEALNPVLEYWEIKWADSVTQTAECWRFDRDLGCCQGGTRWPKQVWRLRICQWIWTKLILSKIFGISASILRYWFWCKQLEKSELSRDLGSLQRTGGDFRQVTTHSAGHFFRCSFLWMSRILL